MSNFSFVEAKGKFESNLQIIICTLAVQNTTNEFIRVSKDGRKVNLNFTVGSGATYKEILMGAEPCIHGELHFKKSRYNDGKRYGAFLHMLLDTAEIQPGEKFAFVGSLTKKPGRPGTVFNNFEVSQVVGYAGDDEPEVIDLDKFMSHEEWLEVTAVLRNGKPVTETTDAAAPEAPEM